MIKLITKLSILFLIVVSFASAQVNLQSGLISCWLMNNSVLDSTSNHLNLITSGMPAAATNRFGTPNSAYNLSSFNPDYFTTVFNTLLSPTELTVSAWVKLPNVTIDQKIAGRAVVGGGYLLGVDSGKIDAEIWDLSAIHYRLKAPGVTANTWTHLAMTFKANNYLKVYINGAVVDSLASGTTGCGTTASFPFTVGGAPWQPTALNADGTIDDIYLYNRAVNDAEIFALYSLVTGINVNEPLVKLNSVYPVPVHDGNLTVEFNNEIKGQVTIEMNDAAGRTVFAHEFFNPHIEQLNLGEFAKGFYTISFLNEARLESHRLVIE